MPLEETVDPDVFIEEKGSHGGEPFVIYVSSSGLRWIIRGECNRCGECWVGANGPEASTVIWTGSPIGEPNAFIDGRDIGRLDCPVLPSIKEDAPSCVLSGEYL